jgi:diguanylate cyclase (GGDEF)-like protein
MLEAARMYRKLAQLAGLDEQLGATDRYAFRQERSLARLLIDIDYFKQCNDYYGHARGDAALRTVARLISGSATRDYDLVAPSGSARASKARASHTAASNRDI